MQKSKMAVWGSLTNSCEKKRSKKQRKGKIKHLTAQFQRIARRDKKAFFSDQCKEIEEKNRMGKARDVFKKIRDTKGTFHAKMDTIKNRNIMDLTEAEDINKRWHEYTGELYKRDLNDPDNHFAFSHFFFMGMVLTPVSCTMSRTSVHSSSGILSIRSSPLNLFLTSLYNHKGFDLGHT